MRLIDEQTLQALEGSRPADTVTAWAWRAGSLVVPEPLQIIDWSAQDAAGDSVNVGQQLSFTVADPDGTLGAWRLDDPLGVAGTELRVIYNVGGAGAVNYGKFRVTGNEPYEVTTSYVVDEYGYIEPDGDLPPHKRRKYVTKAYVKLDVVDLTGRANLDKLEAPQSPGEGATAISEFRRLTQRHFPVVVDPGVVDASVSTLLVFDKGERMNHCQDLASRLGARYRMGGDGECHIYPRNTDPVWTIEPGKSLVKVTRKQSSDGLYNRWVVEGKDAGNEGAPIRGVASITSGPLRYDGPHGRVQFFYSSEMITNQADADNYARKLRDEFLQSLAVELSIETIPWPQGQAGDRVVVGCPVAAGHVAYFTGEVTSIRRGGNPVPDGTSLKVQCSLAEVIEGLSRTDWAQHLTGEIPELTWDRMPGTWGSLPDMPWNTIGRS